MLLNDDDRAHQWQAVFEALEIANDSRRIESLRMDLVYSLAYCSAEIRRQLDEQGPRAASGADGLSSDDDRLAEPKERLVMQMVPIYERYVGHRPDNTRRGSFDRLCRAVFELSAEDIDVPVNSDCFEAVHAVVPNRRPV